MISFNKKEFITLCTCGVLNHVVRFSKEDGCVYIEITIQSKTFFRRLRDILRFLFGFSNQFQVACITVEEDDIKFLRNWFWFDDKKLNNELKDYSN